MAQNIIEISNLTKVYQGGAKALDKVSFNIPEGKIFALLGANGAGKTTLINIVMGLSRKTSGQIKIMGLDLDRHHRNIKYQMGLVPQELSNDHQYKVIESVKIQAGLYGKKPTAGEIDETLTPLALKDKKNTPSGRLSGGMKRRLMIAKALVHQPKILFLDEPTAGVDVELRRGLWDHVLKLKKSGVTIILTTHYLEEAEMLADKIAVIHKGKIVFEGDKEAIFKKFGKKEIIFELSEPLEKLPQSLKQAAMTKINSCKLSFDQSRTKEFHSFQKILDILRRENIKIENIDAHSTNLEEIFVALTHD